MNVDKLARPGTLVADRRSSPSRTSRPKAERVKMPETVESGIASVSAISAAVIRK
jgi:hypothetical protein